MQWLRCRVKGLIRLISLFYLLAHDFVTTALVVSCPPTHSRDQDTVHVSLCQTYCRERELYNWLEIKI